MIDVTLECIYSNLKQRRERDLYTVVCSRLRALTRPDSLLHKILDKRLVVIGN